ncbi:MAG: hypothetical protein V1733_04950 [bacterium]
MKRNDPENEKYCREVEEILQKRPALLVRKGIFFLAILFVGLLVVSHFIRYPERLAASVTFEADTLAGDSEQMTGKIVLTAAAASIVRPKQPVTIYLNSPDSGSIRTIDGAIGVSRPMGAGDYFIVTVIRLSGPVLPGEEGKASILTGESSLLSKILNPVISVFRSANRAEE